MSLYVVPGISSKLALFFSPPHTSGLSGDVSCMHGFRVVHGTELFHTTQKAFHLFGFEQDIWNVCRQMQTTVGRKEIAF